MCDVWPAYVRAEIRIACLGDASQPFLAAGRVLLGHQSAAQVIRPVTGKHASVSFEDLPVHEYELGLQCPQAFHYCRGYTLIGSNWDRNFEHRGTWGDKG